MHHLARDRMNWLAHLLLSPPEIEFQLGNLLADFVRGADRERMSAGFRDGVRCHLRIDAYTDEHPIVQRSKARLHPRWRRFAGIIVDVYYDLLLARHWELFCDWPLREFIRRFHEQVASHVPSLPEDASWVLQRMIEEDRLYSYSHVPGVELALTRLSRRLNARFHRDLRLQDVVPDLVALDADLDADFLEFFPQLVDATRPGPR
jgi:acyl carrier protein phosphodiesterase